MGKIIDFFGAFVATGKTSAGVTTEKQITTDTIKKLVSSFKVKSLDRKEEIAVEQELISRRGSDGKMSFKQIDEVLRKLKHEGVISDVDRKGLTSIFQTWFSK